MFNNYLLGYGRGHSTEQCLTIIYSNNYLLGYGRGHSTEQCLTIIY